MIKEKAADPVKVKLCMMLNVLLAMEQNGEGMKVDGIYVNPPLWGEDSYNKGAGMYRTLKAADFIINNMPFRCYKRESYFNT